MTLDFTSRSVTKTKYKFTFRNLLLKTMRATTDSSDSLHLLLKKSTVYKFSALQMTDSAEAEQ